MVCKAVRIGGELAAEKEDHLGGLGVRSEDPLAGLEVGRESHPEEPGAERGGLLEGLAVEREGWEDQISVVTGLHLDQNQEMVEKKCIRISEMSLLGLHGTMGKREGTMSSP